MKEVNIDNWFDNEFEDIDVSSNEKSERNSVSFKQIYEAYLESTENQKGGAEPTGALAYAK